MGTLKFQENSIKISTNFCPNFFNSSLTSLLLPSSSSSPLSSSTSPTPSFLTSQRNSTLTIPNARKSQNTVKLSSSKNRSNEMKSLIIKNYKKATTLTPTTTETTSLPATRRPSFMNKTTTNRSGSLIFSRHSIHLLPVLLIVTFFLTYSVHSKPLYDRGEYSPKLDSASMSSKSTGDSNLRLAETTKHGGSGDTYADHLLSQMLRNHHTSQRNLPIFPGAADPEEAFDPNSDSILAALEIRPDAHLLRIQTPIESRHKTALIFARKNFHHHSHNKHQKQDENDNKKYEKDNKKSNVENDHNNEEIDNKQHFVESPKTEPHFGEEDDVEAENFGKLKQDVERENRSESQMETDKAGNGAILSDSDDEIRAAAARWLLPENGQHLTLHEAHALVKSVINNRLIEQLDNKTLEHLTRKYGNDISNADRDEDFLELHSATKIKGNGRSGTSNSYIPNDHIGPEDFLENSSSDSSSSPPVTTSGSLSIPDSSTSPSKNTNLEPSTLPGGNLIETKPELGPKAGKGGSVTPPIDSELIKHYENLEQIMQILMHSENTLKKRGQGTHLSIDSALTVLREKLLMELAIRKAKAKQDQIAINSEYLKKLGRRRRSIDDSKQDSEPKSRRSRFETKNSKTLNCELKNCRLDELNSGVWSNIHELLYSYVSKNRLGIKQNLKNRNILAQQNFGQNWAHNLKPTQVVQAPHYNGHSSLLVNKPANKQRLRNNDKYFSFDKKKPSSTSTSLSSSSSSPAVTSTTPETDSELSGIGHYIMDARVRFNSRAPRPQ